ncbi:uncharacterized protein LOC114929457 [Nylanderia fulva]|uniref:uncharacterized protein LOC114929457 n=1 Tax=Nylanderia fulva TaxID=613905 RepID=UPI0010FB4BC2|nr:uncharacterized protein LOC114929457 [Nylanderia fulva]
MRAKRKDVSYFDNAEFEEHEEIFQRTADYMMECLEELEPPLNSTPLRLDHATHKAWRLKGGDDAAIPTFEDLDRFISARVRALEELTSHNAAKSTRSSKSASVNAVTTSPASCPICKASHYLSKCPQFIKKGPSQRMEFIKQHQRCINCLSTKHALYSCPSQYTCRRCQKRHHSMLHVDSVSCATASVVTAESTPPVEARGNRGAVALFASQELSHRTPVLLATARVTFSLSAICGLKADNCKFATQITISPQNKSEPSLTITASILPSLADYNSGLDRARCNWNHLADLALADPHFNGSDPIELLIGADIYGEIFLGEMQKGPRGQPYALNTIFGWAVSGPTSVSIQSRRTITVQHCSASTSLALDRELRRFWEIEEVPRQTVLGPEKQRCKDFFMTTHSRCSDGRYIVRLPFKRDPPINIGRSRDTAERCLKSLLRRFEINAELKQQYFNFMREYEALGHMRKASPLSEFFQCVYIPHHPVFRDGSATTHLRVVFNASSLTSSGKSLNDNLLPGPKLQTDLAAVVMRWRQFRYVYSADVEKMYRQIVVDPRDTDYQRILWVDTETERMQDYKLLTVTYGMASAPFLALRVLRQLVRDEEHSYPLAVFVLTDNIYVDDVLFGAEDISLLRQARDQVCSLLRCGQFNLRKWSSNSSALLSDIDDNDHGLACSKDLQPGEKLDWDDQFPTDLADEWEVIRASLLSLDGLQLDRWVRRGSDTTACELHGFADAFSQAYGLSEASFDLRRGLLDAPRRKV